MDKKRIVIFSEDFPPYPGGIAQWAYGMAIALNRLNHEIHVLTRFRPEYDDFHKSDIEKSFYIVNIKGKRWKQFRTMYCYRAMKKFYEEGNQADLILATTWNFSRGILSLANKNGSKLITVVHGLEVTRKMTNLKKRWLKSSLNGSDAVIAVSQFTRNYLINNFTLDKEKVVFIANGVDPVEFSPSNDSSKLRKRFGLNDEKVILTLARVIERKGHDKVIEALPKVLEKIPNVKYIICGPYEESYYNQLQNQIQTLGLQNVVEFTGYVAADELSKIYNLCDVYIMPNRLIESTGDSEGFGITFLEANACGKPVIGGASGGVGDAILDGETGFLVNPEDSDEIAEKIILLLEDANLANKLGKQGRLRVEKQYTWDAIAERILNKIY